ncbi:recombinase family protein [Paracidovorax citrulli]|nr:recombinase family protein [Paracidovorax citrulli]
MHIGYARVSTREQENRMQLDALKAVGVQKVYQEKASSIGQRPELQRCLKSLRAGDVLVVYKLDRVARSLVDLLAILDRIKAAGAQVRSLNEPLDTTTPMGMFMIQVLGAVAQLERGIIRERVIAGQVAAISRGKRHGRPPTLAEDQEAAVWRAWQAGENNKARLARAFGVERHVVDRVIRLRLNPQDSRYGPRRPVLGPLLQAVR